MAATAPHIRSPYGPGVAAASCGHSSEEEGEIDEGIVTGVSVRGGARGHGRTGRDRGLPPDSHHRGKALKTLKRISLASCT